MNKIAAIVPAFNEELSIAAVIDDIRQIGLAHKLTIDVVVINDCSTDQTAAVISQLPCIPLNLPINLGIGGAVQTGFKYAYLNGYDFAVQIDGDGQHPAAEIPRLLHDLLTRELDVAIGSRFISNEGFQSTFFRRIGIRYFQFLNQLLTGQQITDSTSGLRMLNRRALAIVNRYYPDQYPEPEALILYTACKLKIGEVAVTMRARQGGVSSINSASAVYYMLKVTLAMFFTFIRLRNYNV